MDKRAFIEYPQVSFVVHCHRDVSRGKWASVLPIWACPEFWQGSAVPLPDGLVCERPGYGFWVNLARIRDLDALVLLTVWALQLYSCTVVTAPDSVGLGERKAPSMSDGAARALIARHRSGSVDGGSSQNGRNAGLAGLTVTQSCHTLGRTRSQRKALGVNRPNHRQSPHNPT